nr:MAG TPA: Minor structural protein 4 [Siphoviridae sp. ctweK11]
MEPKYKINPLTGELQEYVFEYNGILVLRNFTAQVDNDRLVVRSASDVNFSILEALVSEVEIDGVLYDNPTAAKEALQRLVFNQNVPVILPEEERKKISSALQSGGYSGTAQDLKKLIDGINAILQSDDTDLDQLQEIVAYIKQNKKILSTLGISNIAGLTDALAEKANKIHKHSWGDIEGKPNLNYLPLTGGVVNGDVTSNNFIKKNSSNEKVLLGGGEEKELSELENKRIIVGGRNYVLNSKERKKITPTNSGWIVDYELSINLEVGEAYVLNYKNYGERMLSILWSSSNSWDNAQEISKGTPFIAKENYKILRFHTTVLNKLCDFELVKLEKGNKATDWTPAPEDLALYEDLIKVGSLITGNVSLNKNHRNLIFFVTANANIDVKGLGDLGSSSFRKVFNEGVVTFTCESKNIIYTGDNTFNGKKGSTAVVSIYDNDCYIDIRNI